MNHPLETPSVARFYNADGSLSAYALGCGYVEVAENADYRCELYREHGCYHVRLLDYKARDAGAPFREWRQWQSTPTLSEARRKFRQLAKVAQ